MESVKERNSTPSDIPFSGVRNLDIVGFNPAFGLSRRQDALKPAENIEATDPKATARVVKVTVNNNNRPAVQPGYRLLTKRQPQKDDTSLKLGLCGSTAFVNKPPSAVRSKSGFTRKNSAVSSLPSIVSKAGSDGALSVTPYYDSDFGFHFERLGPSVGMSQHKAPPSDSHDLEEELAHTAHKHIYSLQIVSTAHRGSKRTESVHSLLNTIWPSPSPTARSRPLLRDDDSMKLPRSRPLVRSNSHVWGSRAASPSKPSTRQQWSRSNYPQQHEIGGLGPVKPKTALPKMEDRGRSVTSGLRK